MKRLVDGLEVELKADEEAATMAEWEANDPKKQPQAAQPVTVESLQAALIAKGVITMDDVSVAQEAIAAVAQDRVSEIRAQPKGVSR